MIELRTLARRAFLGICLLASACAPAVPAAAPPPPVPVATEAPQLATDQRLTIAFSSLPGNMDPHSAVTGTVRRFDVFETPTIYDANGTVRPLLAIDWKTVNPTTWRISLRPDAKFHDGSPVTADDVVYTWQRIFKPELRSPLRQYLLTIDKMTAVDPKTVEIVTKAADPILPRRLFYLAVVPKAYIDRVGDQEFAAKPIGSGPFRFKEFVPADRAVVTGWPEHAYRKPTLTEVTIRAIPDGSARINGLRTGALDLGLLLAVEAAPTLQREGFQVYVDNSTVLGMFLDTHGADGTNVGPIADRKVRQALNYAIDRETIAKQLWQGLARPAGHYLSESVFGGSPIVNPYVYDLAKAKALLAEAGYPNGFKTTLDFWPSTAEVGPTALAIQAQLKLVGVELDLVQMDAATYADKFYKLKVPAPLMMTRTTPAPLYDGTGQLGWFTSDSPNGRRYSNGDFDAKVNASAIELDDVKRAALIKQAAESFQADPPWLGIVTGSAVAAWGPTVLVPSGIPGDYWPQFDTIKRIQKK